MSDEIATEASKTYKRAVDAVCGAVSLLAKLNGESQTMADIALFELAREIKMRPEGRASRFLDHFLYGGGADIRFSSSELLNEDPGVRKRLSDEISRRIREDGPAQEKTQCGANYVISIRQRDFALQEWRNALGSFPFEWELVQISSDRRRLFANVWGANEYKWHPAAERVTQCLHQAGDRLTRSKEIRAKNYWMIATPVLISVATGKPL